MTRGGRPAFRGDLSLLLLNELSGWLVAVETAQDLHRTRRFEARLPSSKTTSSNKTVPRSCGADFGRLAIGALISRSTERR